MAPPFTKFAALAALVAALAVSAAAADASSARKTLELTATDATSVAELALGFDPESARRRALQGEYDGGNPSYDDIGFDDYGIPVSEYDDYDSGDYR